MFFLHASPLDQSLPAGLFLCATSLPPFLPTHAQTEKVLQVDPISPDWQNYTNFMQQVVVEGLVNIVVQNMQFLCDQIDPAQVRTQQRDTAAVPFCSS